MIKHILYNDLQAIKNHITDKMITIMVIIEIRIIILILN